MLQLAYRKKYNLPISDPRFLCLDEIDIYRDIVVMDAYDEQRMKEADIESDDGLDIDDIKDVRKGSDNSVYRVSNKEVTEEEADEYFERMV
jgi:hypothetical protein